MEEKRETNARENATELTARCSWEWVRSIIVRGFERENKGTGAAIGGAEMPDFSSAFSPEQLVCCRRW